MERIPLAENHLGTIFPNWQPSVSDAAVGLASALSSLTSLCSLEALGGPIGKSRLHSPFLLMLLATINANQYPRPSLPDYLHEKHLNILEQITVHPQSCGDFNQKLMVSIHVSGKFILYFLCSPADKPGKQLTNGHRKYNLLGRANDILWSPNTQT